MINKFILFTFILLVFVGCNMTMDRLNVTNGSKYIVTSKMKKADDYHYTYNLIKEGDSFYDYYYEDTTAFDVGDTLVLSIKKIDNYGNN